MMEFENQDGTSAFDQNTRPVKRRKFYRKYVDDDREDTPEVTSCTTESLLTLEELISKEAYALNVEAQEEDEPQLSVVDILRRRKAAQRRKGGIEFSNTIASRKDTSATPQPSDTPIEKDEISADVQMVINRFAPQTGQIVDVDKHMMAFIDSELAKRRQGLDTASLNSNGHGIEGLSLGGSTIDAASRRQPAALGKLHEIDLGPDATLRNIARTEAAKRRLEGGTEEVEEGKGRVRLRRDGKPWRGRRRRNSDDVKRDQLVEEVLKESRLEIYDEPEEAQRNDDQAADDRIAEQFRREFMDAVSSRRQRKGPATAAKPVKGAKVDDRPKGPKLGGSRSARAAMREQQEKALKK